MPQEPTNQAAQGCAQLGVGCALILLGLAGLALAVVLFGALG